MLEEMLKEIMKIYHISKRKAKEMIKEEKEKFSNMINDFQAITYIINRKKFLFK